MWEVVGRGGHRDGGLKDVNFEDILDILKETNKHIRL